MRTVKKVTELVGALKNEGDLGVTELARRIGADKAVVHRILRALVSEDWVEQTSSRKYRIGPGLSDAFEAVPSRSAIIAAATDVLNDLLSVVDETCFLSGRQGNHNVVDLVRESSKEMRVVSEVGRRIELHSGAAGKVLLAYERGSVRSKLLDREREIVEAKGASFEDLLSDLQRIRDTGWSYDPGKFSPGISGLAAPILFRGHTIVGSICIRAPDVRLTERDADLLAPKIVEAGRQVANSIVTDADL